ncbi:MAG: inosine-5-monophosphate dehydrogenase [Planctomycetaceae bacterium]|nr:inosine-5-monophosphate dehydrogenase [Planctomycetaceae bacterium]
MCQLTARDFMATKLITLRPEMDVLQAVKLLLKNRISGAPVVDEDGNFLGVFSEKCAMNFILDAAYEQLPTNEVRAFMKTDAQTIGPDAHLLSVAQVFLLTYHRRLPVLENGRLIGQVSRRDVLKAAMSDVLKDPGRTPETSLLYLSAIRDRSQAPVA